MIIKLNENTNPGILYAIACCEEPDIYSEEFWGWDTKHDLGYELVEFDSLIPDADIFDSLTAAENRADDVLSAVFVDEVFIVGLDPYTPHNLTGFVKKIVKSNMNENYCVYSSSNDGCYKEFTGTEDECNSWIENNKQRFPTSVNLKIQPESELAKWSRDFDINESKSIKSDLNYTSVKESFSDYLTKVHIKSLDDNAVLDLIEMDPIPNTTSFKARYRNGECRNEVRTFVLADSTGDAYLNSKGLDPMDIPVAVLEVNGKDDCFFITTNDFEEYKNLAINSINEFKSIKESVDNVEPQIRHNIIGAFKRELPNMDAKALNYWITKLGNYSLRPDIENAMYGAVDCENWLVFYDNGTINLYQSFWNSVKNGMAEQCRDDCVFMILQLMSTIKESYLIDIANEIGLIYEELNESKSISEDIDYNPEYSNYIEEVAQRIDAGEYDDTYEVCEYVAKKFNKDIDTVRDDINRLINDSKTIKESSYKKGDRVELPNGLTGTVTKDFDWENEDQVSVKIDGTGEIKYPRSEVLRDLSESTTAGSEYVEVAYIHDGFTNFRVFGGGFKTSDSLVAVEDEKGKRFRFTMGDVCEFYTWYDAKGNVIHEPSYNTDN